MRSNAFFARTATDAWLDLVTKTLARGSRSNPRGTPTLEILGNSTIIDMNHPVVLSVDRKLSYRFMAAEAWWILSGRSDAESIGRHCKNIVKFADVEEPTGLHFFGAYGPKIMAQLGHVVETLSRDPDSRQAVINIWRECPPSTRDVPCTLSVQWLIRDGRLFCIDTMRSSDVWLGWPYDVFNFSMISWQLLDLLQLKAGMDLRLGSLQLNAGSQHLYQKDVDRLVDLDLSKSHEFDGSRVGTHACLGIQYELGCCIGEIEGEPIHPFFTNFKNQLINNQK